MISSVQLNAVAERIDSAYLDDFLIAELRTEFIPLHFTYCSDDDVGGSVSPVLEHDRFNLYLIDGREHCLKLTNDTETATGLVVAEIMGD
jgi:hypothetical protein